MRIRLIIFGLSSVIVGFAIGSPGENIWVILPAIVQGHTSFHLWKELKR